MRRIIASTIAGAMLVWLTPCYAQSFGGGFGSSSSGRMGGSSFGSSGRGSSGFGQSGFGQSGFGQSGFGQSGFGQSGFGQSGFGQPGFGQTGFGQTGTTNRNQTGGVRSFTGANRGGGAAIGVAATARQRGQNGTGQLGLATGTPLNAGAQQMRGAARHSMLRVGFEGPQVSNEAIVQAASVTLNPTVIPGLRNLGITVEDGVGVLRGEVASAEESRRAAALLSLEPGIRSVRNELVVREPSE